MNPAIQPELTKICHARVGQQIQLPDAKTGEILPEVFVVVALDQPGKRPARPAMSQGLYDDQRKLVLVSLTTGLARELPHLSSRAKLLKYSDLVQAPVPVLVSQAAGATVSLVLRAPSGSYEPATVNLADINATLAFLGQLISTGSKVVSVQLLTEQAETELLKANWRRAVADGSTLLSFDQYREAA